MRKGAKELIAKAVPRTHNEFFELYVIDSEKKYDGIFGENGYNNIVLIGRAKGCEEYELITEWSDAIHIFSGGCDIDIAHEQGVIRLWSNKGFSLGYEPLSSVIFNDKWGGEEDE